MQICPKCKKGIHYIAKADGVIVCEIEKRTIYTESGRRVEGYAPHKCEVENGGKEENGRSNG